MRRTEDSFEELTAGMQFSDNGRTQSESYCIVKIKFKVQFIRDEEEKLKELIFGMKEKQDEISYALD
jgi:hypothetical protein